MSSLVTLNRPSAAYRPSDRWGTQGWSAICCAGMIRREIKCCQCQQHRLHLSAHPHVYHHHLFFLWIATHLSSVLLHNIMLLSKCKVLIHLTIAISHFFSKENNLITEGILKKTQTRFQMPDLDFDLHTAFAASYRLVKLD